MRPVSQTKASGGQEPTTFKEVRQDRRLIDSYPHKQERRERFSTLSASQATVGSFARLVNWVLTSQTIPTDPVCLVLTSLSFLTTYTRQKLSQSVVMSAIICWRIRRPTLTV